MPSKKKKRAGNPSVRLVSVSGPLPESTTMCLQTLADMAFADANGTMGFLMGMSVPGVSTAITLPAGTATLLMAKLLTPAEYAYVAAHGEDGARELMQRFERDGTHHLSSLARSSAV